MTISEKIADVINDYITINGTDTVMDYNHLYELVNSVYPINKRSFMPSDYCYNRTNEGIDFESHIHLFEMNPDGTYVILGAGYQYTGYVYWKKNGEQEERIYGSWFSGLYHQSDSGICNNPRFKYLFDKISKALYKYRTTLSTEDDVLAVRLQERILCTVGAEKGAYKISKVSQKWSEYTTYRCNESSDGNLYYYLDTVEECVGEVKRIVVSEVLPSELRQTLTAAIFENAYRHLIEQADKNAISKKSGGSKVPIGFSNVPYLDGNEFKYQYGQGSASETPYLHWWTVSVYYVVSTGNVVLGIREGVYPYVYKLNPLKYMMIGNKKTDVAVFYEAQKENVDYQELFERFITVCEKIIKIGFQ